MQSGRRLSLRCPSLMCMLWTQTKKCPYINDVEVTLHFVARLSVCAQVSAPRRTVLENVCVVSLRAELTMRRQFF